MSVWLSFRTELHNEVWRGRFVAAAAFLLALALIFPAASRGQSEPPNLLVASLETPQQGSQPASQSDSKSKTPQTPPAKAPAAQPAKHKIGPLEISGSGDVQVWRDFSVGLYYAHAWGKSVVASIYPKDRNSNYFFLETNLRF